MTNLIVVSIGVLLLIAISAICKAVADKIAHHFELSDFYKMKSPEWWTSHVKRKIKKLGPTTQPVSYYNKMLPNKYKPMVFSYPVDAWHVANSGMIFALVGAAIVPFTLLVKWYIVAIAYPVSGVFFNIIFNIFYNKIFKK